MKLDVKRRHGILTIALRIPECNWQLAVDGERCTQN